jgi:phosphoglycolate phosphatase-like HAD superfamily hydrolase
MLERMCLYPLWQDHHCLDSYGVVIVISNIVWDVDGTLFDTYPAITYALSKSLNRMGKSIALNLIDGLVRQSFQHCVDTLCRRYKVDADVLREQFSRVYRTISPQNQLLIEGVRDMCKCVTMHGGKNVAIIFRDGGSVDRLFAVHNIEPFFAGVHDVSQNDEVDQIAVVLQEHCLKPEETLMIGDRVVSIQAGKAAGCMTCQVGDEVLAGQVDMYITDYKQLLEKIQAQAG